MKPERIAELRELLKPLDHTYCTEMAALEGECDERCRRAKIEKALAETVEELDLVAPLIETARQCAQLEDDSLDAWHAWQCGGEEEYQTFKALETKRQLAESSVRRVALRLFRKRVED